MAAPRMSWSTAIRLWIMMFLQFAIWGAWLPILYPFLLGHRGFTLDQCGLILAGGAAGAILGPFIAGQIADRYFATQRFLAVSHFLGAVLVWFLAGVADFWVFFGMSVLYGLIYAPTLALTNSLSFHHLADRDRDFGRIRLWGTVGWIVVGIAVGHWLAIKHTPDQETAEAAARVTIASWTPEQREEALDKLDDDQKNLKDDALEGAFHTSQTDLFIKSKQDEGRGDAFRLSGIVGLLMAFYCLTLPHTPPAKGAKQASATFAALSHVKRQPLLTLFLLAVPISIIHQFYFVHTSEFLSNLQREAASAEGAAKAINKVLGVGGGGLMTIGQMAEIFVLAGITLVSKRVTRKMLLAVGIVAYAARMFLFAYTDSMPLILLGVALHGFCFGCFIFVGFMIVDEETTSDVRASGQNLFNLVIVGIGIIVGSWFSISVVAKWAGSDFTRLFSVPMWIAVGCLVLLMLFYPSRKPGARSAPGS